MNPSRYHLAIESATTWGSVAVGADGDVLAEVAIAGQRPSRRTPRGPTGGHSSTLLPAIDFALSIAGVRREEISAVVVGAGPGSFTGIRIAGATAKGIVHARGLPLLAYSSLLAAAVPWLADGKPASAMFDARGRDVFAACYRLDAGAIVTLVPPEAMPLDRALERCREHGVGTVTGDAVLRHRAEIERELGIRAAPDEVLHPRAAWLLELAHEHPAAGAVGEPGAWEPEYLRPSGAERIARQRAAAPAR